MIKIAIAQLLANLFPVKRKLVLPGEWERSLAGAQSSNSVSAAAGFL